MIMLDWLDAGSSCLAAWCFSLWVQLTLPKSVLTTPVLTHVFLGVCGTLFYRGECCGYPEIKLVTEMKYALMCNKINDYLSKISAP